MIPFLRAAWTDLIIASYIVPDEWLSPLLPPGVTLHRWDGKAYVSLVAFDFVGARVLGVTSPIPRDLCTFPEVNLRFYASHGGRDGVVFIAELAPNPLVARMANALYFENYRSLKMTSRTTQVRPMRRVRHDITDGDRRYSIAATGSGRRSGDGGDAAYFFKERQWGFGIDQNGAPIYYSVSHPVWETYGLDDFHIDVDFGALFGRPWDNLTGRAPDHIVLAKGSDVVVTSWRRFH